MMLPLAEPVGLQDLFALIDGLLDGLLEILMEVVTELTPELDAEPDTDTELEGDAHGELLADPVVEPVGLSDPFELGVILLERDGEALIVIPADGLIELLSVGLCVAKLLVVTEAWLEDVTNAEKVAVGVCTGDPLAEALAEEIAVAEGTGELVPLVLCVCRGDRLAV